MNELAALPAILDDDTARLLERFDDAAGAAAADALAGDLRTRLGAAFAKSLFVAEYAIRRPAEMLAMMAAPDLGAARTRADYDALLDAALATCHDSAAAKSALRILRRAEMVRIAWRDLELGVDVDTIMGELSAFADAVVTRSVRFAQDALAARFGRACDEHGQPQSLLVLGMGKLGGGELNFSSDIDLLFIYENDGETRGGRKDIEHQEYFDRVGRELIGLLNDKTADGYVFRVDMRLRPFGDSGPLTSSLAAIEHYYALHGRDWERYALIKARALCGDERCRLALEALVRPFVFRRYLDFGALDALREMKALIDRETSSTALNDNVKRGRGGIREIEFTGQLFQLTRGGREARLRQRALMPTLKACAELGLLEADEVATLSASYRFLRMVEHRLQQVRDEQTHSLPRDEKERARIAFAAGFADWDALQAELNRHRHATRALFAALLKPAGAPDEDAAASVSVWESLWQQASEDEPLGARLAELGRADSAVLAELVLALKAERFQARLSQHSRARLDRIMPTLLEWACTRALKDETLQRVAALLRAVAGRSVYLAFLADNPDALARLIELFAASGWIAQQITRHPLLLDELLDARTLYAPPDQSRLHALLAEQLGEAVDLEVAMETLRTFKNSQVLRVAASDITGQFPIAEVSNQLTYIAEACVNAALALAWRDLVARHGEPGYVDGDSRRTAHIAVVAYGKLGGWELGYGSDLDLVFLHDSHGEDQRTQGERAVENNVFFSRLVQRLIHILATVTPSGATYEVDTRLRPSGAAGQLVTNCEAFASYQLREAWVWEHQALVRARAIAGDDRLAARFGDIRAEVLARPRDGEALKRDIVEMRERMCKELDRGNAASFDLKHGPGGITDIEFMVQYAVLRWAGAHPSLLAWTDNLRLLETIADLGLLPATLCRGLHDAYFAYRAELHRCALQQIDGLVDAHVFQAQRQEVREIWNTVLSPQAHAGEST
jgi:glutamate-ammonia-ligase adenylyltransferase